MYKNTELLQGPLCENEREKVHDDRGNTLSVGEAKNGAFYGCSQRYIHTHSARRPSGLVGNYTPATSAEVVSSILVKTFFLFWRL